MNNKEVVFELSKKGVEISIEVDAPLLGIQTIKKCMQYNELNHLLKTQSLIIVDVQPVRDLDKQHITAIILTTIENKNSPLSLDKNIDDSMVHKRLSTKRTIDISRPIRKSKLNPEGSQTFRNTIASTNNLVLIKENIQSFSRRNVRYDLYSDNMRAHNKQRYYLVRIGELPQTYYSMSYNNYSKYLEKIIAKNEKIKLNESRYWLTLMIAKALDVIDINKYYNRYTRKQEIDNNG